jgi:ferrous iron transport protein B
MNLVSLQESQRVNENNTPKKTALIALAGQPNTGKSTLFNLLTGLNQHVGNWPGKTVEQRQGSFTLGERKVNLVDLPGTYSLTANSPEEIITREFILRDHPDVVIAVISAATLERSLYLAAELIALPTPLVIALNMMDVAEQEGLHVEADVLQAAIGIPVIPIIATHAKGISELLQAVEQALAGNIMPAARLPEIRADHRQALNQIISIIRGFVPSPYPTDWTALKLLEGDVEITRMMQKSLPADQWEAVHDILRQHDDAMLAVASGRYEWVGRMVRAAVVRPRGGQISLTERLDRWATHPVGGLAILAAVLAVVFGLTFTVGAPLQELLETQAVNRLANTATTLLATFPSWFSSLVVEGLIGGVGSVLTFLPILAIFFAAFGFLEDVGYMARAAFVMDNFMHLMGLHGRSFLPLFLGFGCNVPSVMGTRVIDSKQARLLTILVSPFMPCTARMAVVAFLAPAFFGGYATAVSLGLVAFSLFVLMLSGIVLNRIIFKGQRSAFIMEMPLYTLPNWRTIGMLVWQRSLSFVQKAGTIILVLSTVVWVLSRFPGGALDSSYLAAIGKFVEPVGKLMGLDWRLTVALLTSFLAKENAIATLGVVFGNASGASLAQTLAAAFSPASALAFLTASMLFIPCAATVAVIRQETGSWRWTALNLGLMLVVSIAASSLVYNIARFFGG